MAGGEPTCRLSHDFIGGRAGNRTQDTRIKSPGVS
jgi:hypothetical protein